MVILYGRILKLIVPDIKEWIREQLKAGYSKEAIRQSLLKDGYNPNLVDEVIAENLKSARGGLGKVYKILFAVIAAGFIFAFYPVFSSHFFKPEASPSLTGQPAGQASLDVSDQSVSNQTIVGDYITIDSIYLDKPGYVVIHEDVDGKQGPIIGNSELLLRERTNLIIPLYANQTGARVFAMLYYDDGDGVYGFADEPVVVAGSVVVKPLDIVKSLYSSQEPSEPPTTREFTIVARRFQFDITNASGNTVANEITVNRNDIVKLTITSADVTHGFQLNRYGINKVINPGDTVKVEFVADLIGALGFFNPINSDMHGILIVR